ncbi:MULTISPECIES: phosphatase PAP2 family protein [Microbacterium]|uniref:phosphatase PAP2 family protein n=1 Tax=Microbacterium TaxID=33882 RepID=UPI0022E92904|nr:phosphatase PAP2 family protein [Microbacterium liquefaciens]
MPAPHQPQDDAARGHGTAGELAEDRRIGTDDLTDWPTRFGSALARFARWLAEKLGPYAALLISLAVGLAIAFALSVVAVEVYDAVTDEDGVAGLDRPLLDLSLQFRNPTTDAVITAITDVAGTIGMPIIAVSAMLILGIRRRSWTPVILITVAAAGSLLMTVAGKELIGRERPPLVDAVPPYEYSPSFPSGHTLNAVVVVGIIVYLILLRQHSRRTRILTITGGVVFALVIGLSRVYLGHHWFTDVLAGWLLGAAWLALVITAHRIYLTARAHRPAGPAPSDRVS